jgi:hypothetical protein
MQVNTKDNSTLPIRGSTQRSRLQTPFVRPQMAMFARVTSYPPLGQITCVRRAQKVLRTEQEDAVSVTTHCVT